MNKYFAASNFILQAIFGKEVRKEGVSHNCVHDAAASMNIALAFIKKPFDTTVAPSKEVFIIDLFTNKL